MQSVLQLI